MTISLDKQYHTIDGREVRIYAVDGKPSQPIHGAICHNGKWEAIQWYDSGAYYSHGNSHLDLVEVKPRIQREEWVNVYPTFTSRGHQTREIAERFAEDGRIACVKPRIQLDEWVNVYPTFTGRGHPTKEIAEQRAEEGRVACIKRTIDCEEGEGL